MAGYHLTLSRAVIPELLEQPPPEPPRVDVLNQVVEAQMNEHLGADRYERYDERRAIAMDVVSAVAT